jgi:hypothetical protein
MAFRLRLTGVGAMNSPRFAPAGLLVEYDGLRVMIDGDQDSPGPLALDAWLVTDDRSELIRRIRRGADSRGVVAQVRRFSSGGLTLRPLPVTHTSHDTFGYQVAAEGRRVVWAPEFWLFPRWAHACDLMFADAAGWDRPIRFAGNVGGHAAAWTVATEARIRHVRRLVFAHIGRPSIRAMELGKRPPYGAFGHDGDIFEPRRWRT